MWPVPGFAGSVILPGMEPKWTPSKALVWVLFWLALGLAELHHVFRLPPHYTLVSVFSLLVLIGAVIHRRFSRSFWQWTKEWATERAERHRAIHPPHRS